jgi:PAS domain S-box-containing protein
MVGLYLVEAEDLVPHSVVGAQSANRRMSIYEGPAGQAVITGRPVLVRNKHTDTVNAASVNSGNHVIQHITNEQGDRQAAADAVQLTPALEQPVAEICVPLFSQNHVAGVLKVAHISGTSLSEADLRIVISLGQHISIAIERSHIYMKARESEDKYRTVINSVKEVIFQTDRRGNWTFLNPAWTEITGYSVQESLGTRCMRHVHPEDFKLVDTAFRTLTEGFTTSGHYIWRYLTRTGDVRWMEVEIQQL